MVKISVIIPYVKDRGFLHEAVRSFENQDYENKELILQQSKHRVGYNLNRGIEKASGDLITYLCDDDLLAEDTLANYANFFDGWDFCHGNAYDFTNFSRTFWRPKIIKPTLNDMLAHNEIHGGTVCYNAKIFKKFQFDESLWGAEEYDFNLMLLKAGMKLEYINKFLYHYRRHSIQKSRGDADHKKSRAKLIGRIRSRYI